MVLVACDVLGHQAACVVLAGPVGPVRLGFRLLRFYLRFSFRHHSRAYSSFFLTLLNASNLFSFIDQCLAIASVALFGGPWLCKWVISASSGSSALPSVLLLL